MLNTMIWKAVHILEENMPRLAYYLHTEYLYLIYSELCLTIECLIKHMLDDNGYDNEVIRRKGHDLIELLKELAKLNDEKSKGIYGALSKHDILIEELSNTKMFINARYMDIDPDLLRDKLSDLWSLLIDVDKIAEKFYEGGELLNLVYPDSMVD